MQVVGNHCRDACFIAGFPAALIRPLTIGSSQAVVPQHCRLRDGGLHGVQN